MIAVTMDPSTVKPFMNRLLKEDILDQFEVRAVEMALSTRISINGALEAPSAPAPHEDPESAVGPEIKPQNQGYISWEALRPLIFAIIKTGAKPKSIKFVFSYKAQEAAAIHANAAALFLNMTYENDTVSFTTATAQKEFALDKSLDDSWDTWVRAFFVGKGITVMDRE